jgi:hypothetical protein
MQSVCVCSWRPGPTRRPQTVCVSLLVASPMAALAALRRFFVWQVLPHPLLNFVSHCVLSRPIGVTRGAIAATPGVFCIYLRADGLRSCGPHMQVTLPVCACLWRPVPTRTPGTACVMSTNVFPFFSVFWFLVWTMELACISRVCVVISRRHGYCRNGRCMGIYLFLARVPRIVNRAQQGMNASDHAGGGRQEILALLA